MARENPGPHPVAALLIWDQDWLLSLLCQSRLLPSTFLYSSQSVLVHPDQDSRLPLRANHQPSVVGGRTSTAASWAFPRVDEVILWPFAPPGP